MTARRRIERILVLPFALLEEDLTEHAGYLGRQLAIAVRNVFIDLAPNVVDVTPMVSDEGGERSWVVAETPLPDEEARRFARARSYPTVARGSLRRDEEDSDRYVLDVSVLRCSDGALLGRRRARGRLMDLVVSISNLFARLGIADAEAVGERARPATEDEEAYASYLLGLDVLLALKTDGISLPDARRALDPFEVALRRDPGLRAALDAGLGTALAVLQSGDHEAASAASHRLALWALRFPDDLRIPALRSEILGQIDRVEEALAVIRGALAGAARESAPLWLRRSSFEARLGRPRDALESLGEARAREDGPDLALRAADLALTLGDAERARRELTALLETDPGRRDWSLRLVLVERVAGYEAEAWARLASLIHDEAPAVPDELRRILGLLAKGPIPQAFRDRLRAWRPRGSMSAEARLLLGRALARSGARLEARLCLRGLDAADFEPEDALALARERLGLADPDFESRFLGLSTRIASGPEATVEEDDLRFLADLVADEPAFWPGRFLHALGLARAGELEAALRAFDEVLAGQPGNDLAWFSRGLQLRKLGRLREARESIETAAELNDEERDYHAQLALLAAELADGVAAWRHFERARGLRPDHPENERLRDLVAKLAS